MRDRGVARPTLAVPPNSPSRQLGVAPADRFGQRPIVRTGMPSRPAFRGSPLDARECPRERDQEIVVRGRDHRFLKRGNGLGGRVRRFVLDARERDGDSVEILVGRVLGRQPCDSRTEFGNHVRYRPPIEITRADKVHEGLLDRARIYGGDLDAASNANVDQTPRVERSHRLANYRTRDPELLAQLALGGQRVTGSQAPRNDRLEDLLGDGVRKTWLGADGT